LGAGCAAGAPDFTDESLAAVWPITLVLVKPAARTVTAPNAIRNAKESGLILI
jgi:hypothetical protein